MSGKKTTPRVFPSGLDEPQTQISMNYATSYLETTVLEYAKMPQKIPNIFSYGVATSQTFFVRNIKRPYRTISYLFALSI